MKYSIGFRNSVLKKVLPPESRAVAEVAHEHGISALTIHGWMKKAKAGILTQSEDESTPMGRSATEKFRVLLESRGIPTAEMGTWLREHGLHAEHLPLYEQELGDIVDERHDKARKRERELKRENEKLKRELVRKEKALAEMAALIVLKKKAEAIWGDDEEDSSESKNGKSQ
ncbi:helix-turn-helix domain-containing protein [Patescibacteria group bacterium]|nr:helix-turn-helix domain-containing protein [Patescibacteria group bacterium]